MFHQPARVAASALLTLFFTAAIAGPGAQIRSSGGWPHPEQERPLVAEWRGTDHTGVASATVPLAWSDTANVRWKVEIPGRGHSTPILAGDRIT